ncbi:unnamed protein product [Arctogadus glacialis]
MRLLLALRALSGHATRISPEFSSRSSRSYTLHLSYLECFVGVALGRSIVQRLDPDTSSLIEDARSAPLGRFSPLQHDAEERPQGALISPLVSHERESLQG